MTGASTVLADLLGRSRAVVALREQIQALLHRQGDARRLPPILLQGETGTGKGLIAHLLHRASPRAAGPFVDVNCAAIPDTLLEAELFGFERGAFTEARHAKPGLFQAAHGGTIFLDEIGLLSESLQGKLLKVLEDRAVRRLGSVLSQAIDVQIVAATGRDLAAAVRERAFREDLYHRLAVLTLRLPALRERDGDGVLLAEHFLARACADYGLPAKRLTPDAKRALLAYEWPGNIRELSNVMERAAIMNEGLAVTADMLALPDVAPRGVTPPRPGSIDDAVRDRVLAALADTHGNITKAAARLGVARNTLLARMARYGLRADSRARSARRREPGGDQSAAAALPPFEAQPEPTGLRWEKRWLSFLRVELLPGDEATAPLGGNRPLEVLTEKVRIFGGRVEEVSPGAVVGVFGLDPTDDPARRAAHAALAIRKAADRARGGGTAAPAFRAGITVGELLIAHTEGQAAIEAEGKREWLEGLSRLVGQATADSILVADGAAPFLDRRFDLLRRTARTYELRGGERSVIPRTQFVGRQAELALIRQTIARVRSGSGHVLAVVGDPGVGKSRLVLEATHLEEVQGFRTLEAQAVPSSGTSPYAPISNLLRTYVGIEDRDDRARIRAKATEAIDALRPALAARLRPPLFALLDLPVEDAEWNAADPPKRREWTLEAGTALLLGESKSRPLMLVCEDLHWIDPGTQAVLDRLVDALPAARFLLLVTYRPEYRHAWSGRTYYTQVPMEPLPLDTAAELVTALIGDRPELEQVRQLLVTRTEGNPFFLEETVRALVETGVLAGESAAFRLARRVDEVAVPATVQAVLAARIDRLPPPHRDLLQAAAVVGRDVPSRLLEAIAPQPSAVTRLLADLRAAEFLYERTLAAEVEHRFKHALTHEVAYETLPAERRRGLHAGIVMAIEHLYPDRLAEHVDRLADHALGGERWEKALTYLRQAGGKAARHSAYAAAARRFEQALTVLARLPPTPDRLAEAIDVRFDLRSVLLPLGQLGRILERLREAEAIATSLGDQRRLGWVATYVTIHGILTADTERSIESGEVAARVAEGAGDPVLTVIANAYLGNAYYDRGHHERATDRLRFSLSTLPASATHERFGQASLPSVYSRTLWALSAAELGRFSEAVDRAAEAVRVAEEADQPFSLGLALLGLGGVHVLQGDWTAAIEALERGLEVGRTRMIPLWIPMTSASLGYAYAQARQRDRALPLLEQASSRADAMKVYWRHSLSLIHLAEGYLLAGRESEARATGEDALRRTDERKELGYRAWALRLLARLAAGRDPLDIDEARRGYHEAMRLAAELGMRPLTAHCHRGLGGLYRRAGQRQETEKHLTTAAAMYRQLVMSFWLEQAEGELAEI